MTPIYSENQGLSNLKCPTEYTVFVSWTALPSKLRIPRTQSLLAKKLSVNQDTLTDWKNRAGFWEKVKTERTNWGKERTSDVVDALYKKILSDADAARIKLWFQYVENWSEKALEVPFRIDFEADRKEYSV